MTRLAAETGVSVKSICADYYMQALLIEAGKPSPLQVEHLIWLIGRAAKAGIVYIVLPFVDQSALRTAEEHAALRVVLGAALPTAEQSGVELHLETDFTPEAIAALLAEINHPMLKANYDIGNSASLGFDPRQELALLAPWLGSVHVKDRVLGGGTVPLGTGAADLDTCFRLIELAGYRRPYIMQVARNDDEDEVVWARSNRDYVERHLAAVAV
jgi:hexulose-6-phosphate isomerase